MKILHITECYGGGVTSAINGYVDSSPDHQHHLWAWIRANDATGEEGGSRYASIHVSSRGLASMMGLRRELASLQPDIIHIHSTFAGVWCRLMPFIDRRKVVYTPHGFAFQRRDGWILTQLYRWVEKLLCTRTTIIAGCSKAEMRQAQALSATVEVCEIINASGNAGQPQAFPRQSTLPVIGMIGRISPQKGYEYFIQVATALRGKAQFLWIGGGDVVTQERLVEAGIEVTGWISREDVLKHLQSLDLYFHTAAWEGFPISVLEAAECRRPMLLRSLPAFCEEGLPVVGSVEQAVFTLEDWLSGDPVVQAVCTATAEQIREYHSLSQQQASLEALYRRFAQDVAGQCLDAQRLGQPETTTDQHTVIQ